jgi:hypothetical protein
LAHSPEDRKRIVRLGLPDQVAARLHLAVKPRCERVGVLAGGGADDQVAPVADRVVALLFQLLGEVAGSLAGAAVDAYLPRREAVRELLLFPRLARRLVVPALLVLEPVLDPVRAADERARALRLCVRVRVDEDVVAVARDREAPGSLDAAQPLEERAGIIGLQVDAKVVDAGILPKSTMPCCSRCFVIPPRKNG